MAGTVLGVAAVLLSATMATANEQKHTARRLSLARSLVLRQLELVQAKVSESTELGNTVTVAQVNATQLSVAQLRAAGRIIALNGPGGPTTSFQGPPSDLESLASATRLQIPDTDQFHVLNTLGVRGSMTAVERARVDAELIQVRLFAALCSMDGFTDEPGPRRLPPDPVWGGYLADLRTLDLIMFQAVVYDISGAGPRQMLSMQRMVRVQRAQIFKVEGKF